MIYYLKDLVDGQVFPSFSQNEMILSLVIVCITVLGIMVSSLILYSLVKQRDIALDSRFVISLTIADIGFSLLILSINSINYSASGWAIGKIGCQIEVAGLVYFIGTSIFSLFGLTAYRWLVVVKQIDITAKQVSIALFFIWGIFACAIIPFAIYSTLDSAGSFLSLQSTPYCMIASHLFTTMNATVAILCTLSVLAPLVLQAIAYTQIVNSYLCARKVTKTRVAKQQKLIEKAIALTVSFALCWICIPIKNIYELSSHQQVPVWFDVLGSIWWTLVPFFNAFILIKYDAKVRQNIKDLLGGDFQWELGSKAKQIHDNFELGPASVHIYSASHDKRLTMPRTVVIDRDDEPTVRM